MLLREGQSTIRTTKNHIDKSDNVYCGCCGARCETFRDVYGPAGYAQALAGIKSSYDYFACPHVDHPLHKNIVKLLEMSSYAGPSLKFFIEQDVKHFVRELRKGALCRM